jgi:hypothetical protein
MATSILSPGTFQATAAPLNGANTSFQGLADVVAGSAQISQTPTIDTITVSTAKTVINFTPFDTANGGGSITFLPSGRTGLFQNDPNSGVTNFTVLNRVIPTDATRAIRFDGTVQSRITNVTGGSAPGGTILFYSPGGIIASSSAVFDVGSLILSAADVGFGEGSNSFNFSGAAPSTAVDINNDASILAQGTGSYVALVAPRIIQSGSVRSDGSVAYIAAEAVDVTIQNNLFDISFVQGTDGGTALTHTGSTELARAPNDGSPQRIYVAAVPKNDAITTLISGSLGYTAATAASVQNGAVILSAGRNVFESGYGVTNFTDFMGSSAPASISIGADASTMFSTSVLTNATGDALIVPAAGTKILFNRGVVLNADRLAEVRAVANSTAIFDADLTVSSNNLLVNSAARVIALGDTGYGGTGYGAMPGTIDVGGSLFLKGGASFQNGMTRTSRAELIADGGHITVDNGTSVFAGDDATENGSLNAFGGNALVRVGAAGSQLSVNDLSVSAVAVAGRMIDEGETLVVGNATGGSARIELAGGNFMSGNIGLAGDALGLAGGTATAGSAALMASGGAVHLGGVSLRAAASMTDIDQPVATSPVTASQNIAVNSGGSQTLTGGNIQLDVINTAVNINGDLILNAEANGSAGLGGLQGGTIDVNVDNGSLLVGDVISASATAEEAASAFEVEPGAVRGGTITGLVSNNGDILASAMNFNANAASGGDAFGGMVSLTTNSGGAIRSIGTIGIGAAATVRSLESGGDAVGGTLLININSGALESGPLILDSSAVGGDAIFGRGGGSAMGGIARINVSGGDSTIEKFSLTTDATGGRGGLGTEDSEAGGAGGAGMAGTSEINITGGTVRTAAFILTSSATGGRGGDGSSGGSGGKAAGGSAAVITSEAANLLLMKVPRDPAPTPLASSINSSARGGAGGFGQSLQGGAGGMANGGTSLLTLAGADIQPNTERFAVDLSVNSEAAGGLGGTSNSASGGAGGLAMGGTATLNLINNKINFDSVSLSTQGSGGSGGNGANSGYGTLSNGGAGGNGSGGAASVTIAAPAADVPATNIANLAIAAEAVGGNGGVGGGGGNGGNAINTGSASFTHTTGSVTIPVATLTANSFGGRGGLGLGGNGGTAGDSHGGTARLKTDGVSASLTVNVAGVSAVARGGDGGVAQVNPNTRGGDAGSATGGTAEILVLNNATASLVLTASTDTSAFGGHGGIGLTGGGVGGNAMGGASGIDGTNGKLDAALLDVISSATGGRGGQAGYGGLPPVSVTGGAGGNATGGTAMLANARFASGESAANVISNANGGEGGSGPSGGIGGMASGGTSSFVSTNLTSNVGAILASSRGFSGAGGDGQNIFNSLGGSGGRSNGGIAQITISGGMLSADSAIVVADALAGSGGFGYQGGNGGNGLGGTASFSNLAGATTQIGIVTLSAGANAGGGSFAADGMFEAMSPAEATGGIGGVGGNGIAGSATLTSGGTSASLIIGDLRVTTIGTAGEGGSGGNGGTTLDDMAGAGGNGGAGGTGSGGVSSVTINGGTAQFNNGPTAGPVMINSSGVGAAGGIGGAGGEVEGEIGASGADGANGAASGGSADLTVLSAQLSAANIRFDSDGRGPGMVSGGNAAFNLTNGATYSGHSLIMTANGIVENNRRRDDVDMVAAPFNPGSNVAQAAATATGGIVLVNVNNANASLGGTLEIAANAEARLGTARGGTVNITATGGTLSTPSTIVSTNGSSFVSETEIGGSGGTINISAENPENGTTGVLNLGATDLQASGFSTPVEGEGVTNAAAGRINITANGGQTPAVNMSSLTAQTLGRNTAFNTNKGIFLNADRGAIIANSAVTLLSDESISVTALDTGNLFVGNDLSAEALNTINITHNGRAANANTILADKADFIAGNAFNAMPGSRVRADTDLNITSRLSSVTTDSLVAGDDLLVTARNGNVSIMSATTLGLGMDRSDIIIDSGAQVTVGAADANASLAVRGANITGTNLTAGEDIALSTNGDISVTTARAGDDFSALSSGGNITLNSIVTDATGVDDRTVNFGYGEIGFTATVANGSVISATAGYGNIDLGTLSAANDLTVNAITIGNLAPADLTAGQNVLLTGQTSVSVGNVTAGRDFSISSNGSASVANASAGDDLIINAAGTVSATGLLLTSGIGVLGDESNIEITTPSTLTFNAANAFSNFLFNGSSISGNSVISGNMIGITADTASSNALRTGTGNIAIDAGTVSVGIANSGLDFIVDTQSAANSSILLDTVTAARDIRLTGGSNGITATRLTAGDDIDVMGSGTVSIANALTNGSFNSGYGSDPSNITISTSFMGRADLTTGRAKDNLTISTGIGGANSSGSLTTDRGDILVNGQMSADIAQATATVGSVTLNAAFVNAGTVSAGTDANVNFFVNGTLGTVTAARDVIVTGSGPAMLTATSLVAGDDIVVTTGGNAIITSARAGSTLRNTSANLTATTLNAGTDLIVLTDMAANLGTATAGARIVTNAGTSIAFTQLMSGTTTSLTAGTSIAGGNTNAGTMLSLNANGGAVGFGALTSGGSTTITASDAIMGNSANAGGALTLNSGANGIAVTSLSSGSGSNLTVTASNGGGATIGTATSGLDISVNATNVSVAAGTAARDVLFTAANNIVAGTTNAGRTVALNAVGTINANTTTAVGDILANSSGNASLVTSTADNIFVVSTGDATLGNASVKTMIGVNAQNVSGTTLTAVEDIRVIAGGVASIESATAGDDFDVSATNGITLGSITVTGTARDDRSLVFNAPAFAVVASPADGSDIRLSSNGAVTAVNLDAGDDIRIGGGNVTLTGLAKTRGLGVTDTGSDVVINGNAVSVAMVNAASNLAVNSESFAGTSLNAGRAITIITSENQSLGTATAVQGPITGNSTRGTISFVDLSTGGDITVNAGNAIAGGNANAGGSIQLAASNGVNFGALTSGGSTNISGGSVSGSNINTNGDVFVAGDVINLGGVTSNFASVFLSDRDVTIGTAGARFDFIVDTDKPANSRIALGNVTVGRDILLTGATNGLTATNLRAGDDINIDIIGNAKIGIAITDGSFNSGYGDDGHGDITRPINIGEFGYGGADLSNITLNAAQAMIGTAQARDNVTLTTPAGTMAGTVIADRGAVFVNGGTSANIMNATATLGAVTINADAITADNVNAATNVALNFGSSAILGTVVAGDALGLNGSGNAALISLTSGNATTIMAGGNVTGGTSTAGSLLSVMADNIDVDSLTSTRSNVVASARSVDIGMTTAAIDALIDTKSLTNSSIVLGAVTAGNDINIAGGTNGITATNLTAGDDIDVMGSGNINVANALTNGTGMDLNNVTLMAAAQAMVGTAQARDNISVFGTNGVMATALTADRGTVLVNSGTSANVGAATASQGSVTINGGNINAGTVSAKTDANLNFGGTMMAGSVTAGNSINVNGNGPSVVISRRDVIINQAIAGLDVIIDTAGLPNSSIQLGDVTATRDISLSGATNGLSAAVLTAGDDITVVGAGNVDIASASANGGFNSGYGDMVDPSNLSVTANSGTITLGNGRAKDNATLTTTGGATATALTADRGAITVRGGAAATVDNATATLANVDIMANSVTTRAINAGTDAAIVYDSGASLGSVTAGQTIAISGTGNGAFTSLSSGTTTRVNSGAALTGRTINAGTSLNATTVGALTTTGPITAGTSATIMGGSITTANASAGTTLSLSASSGMIRTADLVGGAGVQLRGSASATTGNVTATANNVDIVLADGLVSGNVTAANNIIIGNTANAVTAGALSAGNGIAVNNGGAITLSSASGSDITLASTGGMINAGTVDARGALTGTAATGLTLGTATASRNIALTAQTINATTLTAATNIAATSSGAITLGTARATGGNLNLAAAGTLAVMNGGALGDVRLTATNGGNITTGTLSSGSAFMGGTTGGMPGAGDIVITSDGSATMSGNSSAGRNLNVTARNLISVGGVANGTAIDLRSTDIAVNTTAGRIGEQGRTTVAQLTNTGTGVTTIGGAGVTTGYSLSNAEAQRIFAGDIIITAARTATPPAGTQTAQTLNAAAPDVVLDALTLTGATGQSGATGGNIGATGRLRIETPGKLRTVGAVAISNLASANRFEVNAAQSIEVDAATGSVSLSGTAGTLGGTIELTAPSVIAANLPAISAVAAAVDGRAINDRLAINDNAISDAGAFSANSIIVNVTNGFFVQNSGIKELSAFSFGDRRGVTVGSGGLIINAASPTTRIFVSGRQLQANGTFITGVPFLRGQSINGTQIQLSTFPPTPFDSASTINGCAIINSAACLINIDGGSLARDVVGQSDDDGGGSSENSASGSTDFVRFEFKSLDASTFAPVIDDPVTGVGNDDLYALYDARDCNDDQNLESCAKPEIKPE